VDATGEIFGDVPNIAARAQAMAEPGSVVVTARVQRQIAGLFVAEERGSHELKGVPAPLERSALIEAVEQLTRALGQIATLPATPALRREQIKLQVALITPLSHVKGYAAPETEAAAERARLLIEQAEARGPSAIASDATFSANAYLSVFGIAGSQVQIQHFIDQVNFFKTIYTASGAFGTDANRVDLLARGASGQS
jgi:Adenylate and Guanylate cyclase catalytic domain